MIVFSNTTPFIALASIKQLDLLPQLFQQIHVVEEVVAECRAGSRVTVVTIHTPHSSPPAPQGEREQDRLDIDD